MAKYVTGETITVDGGQLVGPPGFRGSIAGGTVEG
jgi:hypothetical protein